MYITIFLSTFFVSFAGLIALFLFRAWELKQGRVTRHTPAEPIAPRVYELRHSVKETCYYILLGVVKGVYRVWRSIKRMLRTKTGIGSLQNTVNGKQKVEKKNGSSLYLKDITTHKKELRSGKKQEEVEKETSKKKE